MRRFVSLGLLAILAGACPAAAQRATGPNAAGHFVPATAYFNDFGPGTDGTLNCSTTTTLTRVQFWSDATLASGCDLQPKTFAIYVNGTLTIQSGGKISANGPAGPSGTGASTCTATAVHTYGPGYLGGYNFTLNNPGAPSALGGLGNLVMLGGNGGAGGTGSNASGFAGGGSAFSYKSGSNNLAAFSMDFLVRGFALTPGGGTSALSYPMGGGGGGEGGTGSGGAGPTGGCGGDVIGIIARKVVINAGGRIESIGGNGAAASNANAGGGGGAGGGAVIIKTLDYTNNGTIDLSGGAGGLGNGTGLVGVSGSAGAAYVFTPAAP